MLAKIPVRSVINYPVYHHQVSTDDSLETIIGVFTRTTEVVLPVVEGDEEEGTFRYTGLILLDSIQPLLASVEQAQERMVAADLQVRFVAVGLDDRLADMLDVFREYEYPELPVVDETEHIVGFLRPSQIIGAYHRAALTDANTRQPD